MNATWSPRVLLTLLVVVVAALAIELGGPLSMLAALGALLAVVVRVAVAATEPVEAEEGSGDASDRDTS